MSKFSIRKSIAVGNTRIKLYKLIIDNSCQVDEFEKLILLEGTFGKDIGKIYATIEAACNLSILPKTLYRVLKLPGTSLKVYEAKSASLRYYLIKLEKTGKVIVLAGKKNGQKLDLKHLGKLIQEIHSQGIQN
ncbi:hypothetical protein [Dyadobacter chenhuakuii]|uniref:Phage derived Gp49-like protein DUF891 n=1 Tax=Dyadobacter chenhuakuii TaxID=2909339 RepID=A0ABY4XGR5_9BACT|nr:hypothetical protein [Dyadobacter chenhuakuii]MCF2495462.1 hypothetical protein [Dyadobacter chenhuakuii]USJ29499.1 hypothetical protein NFI80_16625 [Dyadobacter chenhuakuii]